MWKSDLNSVEAVAALVDDEWFLVRDSGELPETAYHAALYYLTVDPKGPRVELSEEQRQSLLEAASLRFCEIILRDLNFHKRNSPASRGMARAIINYQRFSAFSKRQEFDGEDVRMRVRAAFESYLCAALREKDVVLNCSLLELYMFAEELETEVSDAVVTSFIFPELVEF